MDKLLRFSDYDIFAYLASGFTALAGWDLVFSTRYVIGAQWSVSTGAITIVTAYVIGQILASPAAWLIERQLVRRSLGRPTELLTRTESLRGWRKLASHSVLAEYYRPLDDSLTSHLRTFMTTEGISSGEGLFWRAFSLAKRSPESMARLDTFLRLYGFCRNIAFVAILIGMGLITKLILHWQSAGWNKATDLLAVYFGISLFVAIGMLHRYLKFYRLFGVEVLVTLFNSLKQEPKPQ
jgi:hypothetical protein